MPTMASLITIKLISWRGEISGLVLEYRDRIIAGVSVKSQYLCLGCGIKSNKRKCYSFSGRSL